MNDVTSELRAACAAVASRARHVRIRHEAITDYARGLRLAPSGPGIDPTDHLLAGTREQLAAFWITLDAINFGSGWFPTLRKREGRSGYLTIAGGLRERFEHRGPWSAAELAALDAAELARELDQDPRHELMSLFACSLNDLGRRLGEECGGRFTALVQDAGGSAVSLVTRLGGWHCFADVSSYEDLTLPFLKRAQIAAADLARAGVVRFDDLDRLTMFADNLVPHVLRVDGVLELEVALLERIERGEPIDHGSRAEVEIRACALHAVELIVAEQPQTRAAEIDSLLWHRGQQPLYKASPRHRSRCTAY